MNEINTPTTPPTSSSSDLFGEAADEMLTDAQRSRLRRAHRQARKTIRKHTSPDRED